MIVWCLKASFHPRQRFASRKMLPMSHMSNNKKKYVTKCVFSGTLWTQSKFRSTLLVKQTDYIYLYELIMINLDKGPFVHFMSAFRFFFAQHLSLHLVLREVKKWTKLSGISSMNEHKVRFAGWEEVVIVSNINVNWKGWCLNFLIFINRAWHKKRPAYAGLRQW